MHPLKKERVREAFKKYMWILKGLLTDKSDAIGSCNLKPNDNDNENDDNLSSN